MTFLPSHLVVAVLLTADIHFCFCQPGVGIDMESRKRVRNRRGGDVRGFSVGRLRGRRPGFGFIRRRLHSEPSSLGFARFKAGLSALIAPTSRSAWTICIKTHSSRANDRLSAQSSVFRSVRMMWTSNLAGRRGSRAIAHRFRLSRISKGVPAPWIWARAVGVLSSVPPANGSVSI